MRDTKDAGNTIIAVAVRFALLLAGGGILGVLLLTLAYKLPLNQDNKASSMSQELEMRGGYPLVNKATNFVSFFASFEPGVLDDGTDFTILENVFNEEEGSALHRAMDMRGYSRYWHGYVSLLRPLFFFLDYWDFRLLNGMAQILLVTGLALAVWQSTGRKRYVLAMLSSYGLLMPLALAMSLQYSPVFYISFLGSLIAVKKWGFLVERSRYLYFFLILGMITSYLDFLTYPLLAWAFPLCWLLVASGEALDAAGRFRTMVLSAGSWILGYVGFFVLKWCFASLVLGHGVARESFGVALFRMGDAMEDYQTLFQTYNRFEGLYTNWRHYQFPGYALMITAWILWAFFYLVRKGWRIREKSMVFLIAACSGPVWYLLVSNHTVHHHFFTYRIYGASILAFVLFLCESVETEETGDSKLALMTGRLALLGVLFCAGWGLSRLAKEDVAPLYGGDNQELPLWEGDVYETEFSPSFGNIKEIGFCIRGEELEGYCNVELLSEGQPLYRVQFPLQNFEAYAYQAERVEWNLDSGAQYTLRFSPEGNAREIRLLLTLDGIKPMTEFGNGSYNGEALEGETEPLAGIVYHTTVRSRLTRLYLALNCMAFLAAVLWSALALAGRKEGWKDTMRRVNGYGREQSDEEPGPGQL